MILDLEKTSGSDGSNFDVCVAGAGAAGLVLAVELLKQGKHVLILESGGLQQERRTQALYKSEVVGRHYYGLHAGRFRTLGGSTTKWHGQILELDNMDFIGRSWVPGSGWPIKKSELTTCYARAIELEGLDQSILDDGEVWTERGHTPPILGDELTFSFSRYYVGEPNFARLYESALKTHANLKLYIHANVCELIFGEDGETVKALRARTLTGKEANFTADRFVLCMGGIESSRFLLQPFATGAPWNRELVGRHYQDHIHCFAADIVDAKLDGNWHFGPDLVRIKDHVYHPKIKLTPGAQERYGVLNVCGLAGFDDKLDRARKIARMVRHGPVSAVRLSDFLHLFPRIPALAWGKVRKRVGSKFVPSTAPLKLSVYCEQSPLSQSRITLSLKRDAIGLFQTRLDWKISPQEIATVRRYVQVAREAFRQWGFARIEPDPDLFNDNIERKFRECFHHMGGTRMAASASRGVVDPNLQLYGTRNVYICSSSVFPCSGFANPTHTLLALAVRLARHLKKLPVVRQDMR